MEIKNTVIQIELTNHCNGNCPWCENSRMKRQKGFMNLDSAKQIIEKIKDRQNYVFLHFYGEPLLHPQLIEIIELFYQNGINTGLYTNGQLLTDRMINALAESNLRDIFISMNRFNPRRQVEKLREKSNLNITVVILNLPKKFPNKLKAIELSKWVDKVKKETDKDIRIQAQGYENPKTKECCFKNKKGECFFRKNNQYWVLWNGDLITCLKDHEGETKVGTFKDLDKVKYKNNLCPF